MKNIKDTATQRPWISATERWRIKRDPPGEDDKKLFFNHCYSLLSALKPGGLEISPCQYDKMMFSVSFFNATYYYLLFTILFKIMRKLRLF